jgi:hypothetical protein
MLVKPNIRTELTVEQAGLLIAAIDAEIAKGAGTFLSDADVKNLAQIAHNLTVHINFAGA